jgi:hypothetical protein
LLYLRLLSNEYTYYIISDVTSFILLHTDVSVEPVAYLFDVLIGSKAVPLQAWGGPVRVPGS